MRFRRHAIVVILLYLVLDLCLASMPGAFVFDVAASVETVQRQRPHDVDLAVRALVRDPRAVVAVPPPAPRRRAAAVTAPAPPWVPLHAGADRSSAPEFSPHPEDPH